MNFDEIVDRRHTSSIKWDKYGSRDILPLWVADMDFRAPEPVIQALEKRVRHGIFGYTHPPEALLDIVLSMLQSEYGWQVEKEAIVWLPGLVTGINLACRTAGGKSAITSIPIYPPFLSAPIHSKMKVFKSSMILDEGKWVDDMDSLEKSVISGSSLFLHCNPHNPTGRIFERSELLQIAEFCERHDLIICSDEIHCGILLDKRKHIPIASLSKEIERRTITLMAPSKTYNIPGLAVSFAVIPDPNLRKRFLAEMEGIVPHVNALGYEAALAAYRDSGKWHEALIDYLRKNRDLIEKSVKEMGLEMAHVEATYLAWIDARKIENPASFFENAGVGLSNGEDFGCRGFVRLNFGCPRSRLIEALNRMKSAMN